MSRGFRVWDKQTKSYECDREFVLGSSGELMELYSNHNGTWEYHFADTNRFIVEFETGFTDKNGKNIREGDIVKVYAWTNLTRGMEYRHTTKVFWQEKYAQFNTTYNDVLSDEITRDFFEVIGNIHENKELLGGEE